MKKFFLFSSLVLFLILILYMIIGYSIPNSDFESGKNDKLRFVKDILSPQQKSFITNTFFPNKIIKKQKNKISTQNALIDQLYKNLISFEVLFKKSNLSFSTNIVEKIDLDDNFFLSKYKIKDGFYSGINNHYPGSGYIDFHQDNLFVLSTRGVLGYSKIYNKKDKMTFNQIRNNIDEFISLEQFNKSLLYSLRDLTIYKNKIFISYTEEIKTNCWNTSVIFGEISYDEIKFKKLFSPKDCVIDIGNSSVNTIDMEYNPQSSGGRIVILDDNNIILSVGEYKNRYLSQDKQSVNGKIIKININNSNYEIFSMGHRNPQGLYYDEDNNFILETEHGPQGGDEINLIELDNIEIPNYGWAISSYGEHYGGKNLEANKVKYEKYPLHKTHKKYGFIEPLHAFVPSIGISELEKIGKNKYVTSSLNNRSLYFFELNKDNKVINLQKLEVFERIRDIIFKDSKIFMFMEDTASIGVLKLNIN